ncbi:MAG TPA: DUF1571 domain-containing protein [Pirellulales bacterium]|nr:DUF1571 domain-containing protein [Pirellulales bacterium]
MSSARPPATPQQPLVNVLKYARQEQEYLRQTLRDFTCRLVKRERIDGFLQDYNYIDLQVREEARDGQRIITPLSIYMQFLAPMKVAGRQVLFVEGRNDGKMLVRNGGKHFDYVVVKVDPQGESALQESLVPITEVGFHRVLSHMIEVLERHLQADPTGANTQANRVSGAKVNKRPCTIIRIVHPVRQKDLEFHMVNVYTDDELHVPLRVEYFDWPKRPDQPAPLIAEYTYTNLVLNVNLTEAAFDPAVIRGNR